MADVGSGTEDVRIEYIGIGESAVDAELNDAIEDVERVVDGIAGMNEVMTIPERDSLGDGAVAIILALNPFIALPEGRKRDDLFDLRSIAIRPPAELESGMEIGAGIVEVDGGDITVKQAQEAGGMGMANDVDERVCRDIWGAAMIGDDFVEIELRRRVGEEIELVNEHSSDAVENGELRMM